MRARLTHPAGLQEVKRMAQETAPGAGGLAVDEFVPVTYNVRSQC